MSTWRQEARAAGWAPPRAKRPRREVEDDDYAAMVLRIVAKLGDRAAENPETLALLAQVADAVNVALTVGARGAHYGEPAASWSHIGSQLGISKQAAAQRFGYERPDR